MRYCIEKIIFVLIIVMIFVSIFSCAYDKQKSSTQSVNKSTVQAVTYVEPKKQTTKKKIVKHKEKEYVTTTLIKEEEKSKAQTNTNNAVSPATFRQLGELHHNGHRFTWYSEKVLPGGGLSIPGRHVNNNGYVCDENGYVALASCDYNQGTVLDTPLGIQGKVYDICPVSGTVDVYVSW